MAQVKTNFRHSHSASRRTPWSYRAGTTPLHRCPAGIKLIILFLLSASPVLGPLFAGGAALLVFLGAISAGLKPRELLSGSMPLVIMLLIFTMLRTITGQPGTEFRLTAFHLDLTALQNGLFFSAGILVCFAAASLFFAVTTTTEIRHSLSQIELFLSGLFRKKSLPPPKQSRLSLALALMLGFLPRFFECWENADTAAKARCCKGGLKRVMVILPLVTERMIETAAETAEALESRGLEL